MKNLKAPHMHYCPGCRKDFSCSSWGHEDESPRICTACRRRQARVDRAEAEHALYRFKQDTKRLMRGEAMFHF